jgi:hypothetical protein
MNANGANVEELDLKTDALPMSLALSITGNIIKTVLF